MVVARIKISYEVPASAKSAAADIQQGMSRLKPDIFQKLELQPAQPLPIPAYRVLRIFSNPKIRVPAIGLQIILPII